MSTLIAWIKAARLPSQSNIAPSLILGQALAYAHTTIFSWEVFGWLVVFGLFDQLYIVFANDVADVETDIRNRTATPFSGGSRVVPEGKLTLRALGIAAMVSAALLILTSAVLSLVYARPLAPVFAFCALALLWAYSYPPFRMSYRGGGEILQMVGIGVVLPFLGYYAQVGSLAGFPMPLLLSTLPLQLAGAIATALPDAPSDAESKKLTLAVRLGLGNAQLFAIVLQVLGLALYAGVGLTDPNALETWAVLAAPILCVVAQTVTPTAVPGERSMLLRVFLILTANLSFTVGLIVLGFSA